MCSCVYIWCSAVLCSRERMAWSDFACTLPWRGKVRVLSNPYSFFRLMFDVDIVLLRISTMFFNPRRLAAGIEFLIQLIIPADADNWLRFERWSVCRSVAGAACASIVWFILSVITMELVGMSAEPKHRFFSLIIIYSIVNWWLNYQIFKYLWIIYRNLIRKIIILKQKGLNWIYCNHMDIWYI